MEMIIEPAKPIVESETSGGLQFFYFRCGACGRPIHATEVTCKHCAAPIDWLRLDKSIIESIAKTMEM